MNIIVYTAIFGTSDELWTPQPLAVGGCRHVCFSDRPRRQVGVWRDESRMERGTGRMMTPSIWEVQIMSSQGDDRTSARHYKVLPHKYLSEADVTIWVDGNLRMLTTPQKAVSQWLGTAPLAAFQHPVRDCLYDEVKHCLVVPRAKIYAPELRRQAAAYAKAGMPKHWGLAETRCVIRANTAKVSELGDLWWNEIQHRSPRDQVSLPYVCWKIGVKWNVIPGVMRLSPAPGRASGHFWLIKHGHIV